MTVDLSVIAGPSKAQGVVWIEAVIKTHHVSCWSCDTDDLN